MEESKNRVVENKKRKMKELNWRGRKRDKKRFVIDEFVFVIVLGRS